MSTKTKKKRTRKPSAFTVLTQGFQRRLLEKALRKHDGNQLHAAETLGVHRAFLFRLIKRLKPKAPINHKVGHPVSA